ncbi:MAG: glycosyltransferase [Bacillota bacterium]|nr:glycosyltransferase [Bacillota bacterium]
MKIAWFNIPAHGHTNPTLALVKELTDAGHEVTYFSFEKFRKKIESKGAVFVSCDGYDLNIDAKDGGNRVGRDLAFSIELIVESTLAMDGLMERVIPEIRPDLIIADSMAFYGKLAAMKFGIPYVCSNTTFAFNRYAAKYMNQGMGNLFGTLLAMPKIKKQLKRLQEKGYMVKSFLELISSDNDTNTIVYTSKEFQPFADTFSDKYCFIGPSIRPVEEPVEKTADKTVYISMGTVLSSRKMYENCVEALRDTNYQVILSMGETDAEFTDLPENIKVCSSVDQMAVLEISDAFITHCGMNSVSEGLYFEVPLILVPQTPEQLAVAKRAEEMGAGVMLAETERSAVDIRNAVEQVLGDGSFKAAASKISKGFKNSGGVKEAREFLEKTIYMSR